MKIDGKALAKAHAEKISKQVSDQAVEGGGKDDMSEPEHIQHMVLLIRAMDKMDAEAAHHHMMKYANCVSKMDKVKEKEMD